MADSGLLLYCGKMRRFLLRNIKKTVIYIYSLWILFME